MKYSREILRYHRYANTCTDKDIFVYIYILYIFVLIHIPRKHPHEYKSEMYP